MRDLERQWTLWNDSLLAKNLQKLEKQVLEPILSRSFGQHLLQASIAGATPLFEQVHLPFKSFVTFDYPLAKPAGAFVAEPDCLPVGNETVDLLLLHHVLEFSNNPHQILRESQRVLTSGGSLVIVGFNPYSLWGLRKFLTMTNQMPWSGKYRTHSQLSDWLRLLDCQPESAQFGFLSPPIGSNSMLSRVERLEKFGRRINCILGAFYVLVARKQVAGSIPVDQKKQRNRILSFPLAEPAARGISAPQRAVSIVKAPNVRR